MSSENLTQIIARAVTDAPFRELLFSRSEQAVAGYELTDEERVLLQNLSRENFDAAACELEERMSRGGIGTMGSLDTLLSPIHKP